MAKPRANKLSAKQCYEEARTRIAKAGAGAAKLDLSGLPALKELPSLQALDGLRSLTLDQTAVSDLEPIADLQELRQLSLSQTKVHDLGPLAKLDKLEGLLIGGTQIADLSPISNLKRLESLGVVGSKVESLAPLSKLTSMTVLACADTPIRDLRPLARMRNLYALMIDGTLVDDLSPIADLVTLVHLTIRDTNISDLAPVSKLRLLEELKLDDSEVSDLMPVADLIRLYYSNKTDLGLSFSGCPLADPMLLEFSKQGNPARTINTITYLRQRAGLPPLEEEVGGKNDDDETAPPALPSQRPGPHFKIADDGRISFAAAEDIDQQGNNVGRLRELHPELVQLSAEAVSALEKNNRPHALVLERCQSYRDIVSHPLEEVPFGRLYMAGVRLQNAVDATAKKIGEGELPLFGEDAHEALESLLRLHGPFLLSTGVGLELIAAEDRYQRNPAEEQQFRRAARQFASELGQQPDLIDPEVAKLVADAASEIGVGKNPERSTVISSATTVNATIVLVAAASLAALPPVGLALAGTAGAVGGTAATLLGYEALKKSKPFLMVAGVITQRLDKFSETEIAEQLRSWGHQLARHADFVSKAEPSLRQLSELSQFRWLSATLDWLAARRKRER